VNAQPTLMCDAQPTVGAHPYAQPSPPRYDRAAQWAFGVAVVLWAVGVLADKVGCTAQGYAGVVLGGAALGVSVAYAAAHDWAAHRARQAAQVWPEMWAPISAGEARATLQQVAAQSRKTHMTGMDLGGAE
jgi:hypothetical protein